MPYPISAVVYVIKPCTSFRAGMSFISTDKTFHRPISTGATELDRLLGGSLEAGLMHLFYGSNRLRDDLLGFAVHCQLPEEEGGFNGPCIMINSNNILMTDRPTDIAFTLSIEPEVAMDNFFSRSFNHSQTNDPLGGLLLRTCGHSSSAHLSQTLLDRSIA